MEYKLESFSHVSGKLGIVLVVTYDPNNSDDRTNAQEFTASAYNSFGAYLPEWSCELIREPGQYRALAVNFFDRAADGIERLIEAVKAAWNKQSRATELENWRRVWATP